MKTTTIPNNPLRVTHPNPSQEGKEKINPELATNHNKLENLTMRMATNHNNVDKSKQMNFL